MAVAVSAAPLAKRSRDAASSHDDSHNVSPAKAPALMYSFAANVLGGTPSIHIPIKLNKAHPPCAQQLLAPAADAALTAEERLLVSVLCLVWAQLNSELNLGAAPCASSQLRTNLTLCGRPPSVSRCQRYSARRLIPRTHRRTGVPSCTYSLCFHPLSCLQALRDPIACMCGALGLPRDHIHSKGKCTKGIAMCPFSFTFTRRIDHLFLLHLRVHLTIMPPPLDRACFA